MKYRRLNSLTTVIMSVTMLISITAMLLIFVMLNKRFSDSINSNIKNHSIQLINVVSDNVDAYIKEMDTISNQFTQKIQTYGIEGIQQQEPDFFLRTDIENIMLVDSLGEIYFASGNGELRKDIEVTTMPWYSEIVPGTGQTYLTAPHVQEFYKSNFNWVISMIKGVTWKDKGEVLKQGFIIIDMNFTNIRKLCSSFVENGYIFIVNNDEEIIYHPQQQSLYLGAKRKELEQITKLSSEITDQEEVNLEEKDVMLTKRFVVDTDWTLMGVAPMQSIFSQDKGFGRFVTLLLFSVFLFVMIASLITSRLITNPIYKLINLMKNVEKGTLDSYSSIRGFTEVEQLSSSYNNMIYSLKKMMNRIIKDQDDLRKAEIRTLHNQINPHFLYNTLDSILWLAESGERSKVVILIDSLAKFFRLSLARGRDTLTVQEEVNHVESYLVIQKMRYSDQFEYHIQIDEAVKDYLVQKITLQPIVENAIIHGVAQSFDKGNIWIKAYKKENMLFFEVIDDGLGIDEETLSKLNSSGVSSKGIGISNVKQRIKITYGDDYRVEIESEREEGTKVIITLPLVKEEES